MRRLLAIALALTALGAYALVAGGAAEPVQRSYWVELDNAFGVIPGSDFKVAGVRAGAITEMKVDQRTKKALVGFRIEVPGVKALRIDATCESRPQSLIGEYFIDCQPGRSPTELPVGGTIPVSQTFSTIPADLVNNILRLPQRERLRVILSELGAGTAARGEDLNAVVRRAVPALRETDRLLDVLADENRTIERLTVNADTVVGELTGNRRQLTRFIREARDTSAATADRKVALRQTFRRLPAFLRQLRPTMVDLGQVADEQIPTLQDLDAASGNLKLFLEELVPFSAASRPSLETLGKTSHTGRAVIPAATETVEELDEFTPRTPELAKNLAIVLNDLRDRDRAVERDARSPGGEGYNGFEALLRYVWAQSQAINIFDRNGYILKVAVYEEEGCSEYHDQSVRNEPEIIEKCASALGPTQPGINAPDPSTGRDPGDGTKFLRQAQRARDAQEVLAGSQSAAGAQPQDGAQGTTPAQPGRVTPIDIGGSLRRLMTGDTSGRTLARPAASQRTSAELLNFLLAP